MVIFKILQAGELVLRQTARPLTVEEIKQEQTQVLIQQMQHTLRDAPGVGLAAPQIGLSIQLLVIEDRPEYSQSLPPSLVAEQGRQPVPFHAIINPKLVKGPESVTFFEGCLSIASLVALVPRAKTVTVECLNERAEPVVIKASGWYARILQHEIDHLHGRLCCDHMRPRSLMSVDNFRRYWLHKPIQQTCEELQIDNSSPRSPDSRNEL